MSARGCHITANFGAKPFRYTPAAVDGKKFKTAADKALKHGTVAADEISRIAQWIGGIAVDSAPDSPMDTPEDIADVPESPMDIHEDIIDSTVHELPEYDSAEDSEGSPQARGAGEDEPAKEARLPAEAKAGFDNGLKVDSERPPASASGSGSASTPGSEIPDLPQDPDIDPKSG